MSKTGRRLGRGLDSLVSDLRLAEMEGERPVAFPPTERPGLPESASGGGVQAVMLPPDALDPNPFQPRTTTAEEGLDALAKSIRQSGILQPILVRQREKRYQIIAGERRWKAARLCGMTRIPVVVRAATDEQMLELALVENLQREDLNAIDRAKAYRQFCEHFGIRPEELADRMGEDRSTVVNYLRMLELPESVQAEVAAGRLTMGHGRCLLGIMDPADRIRLAEVVTQNELSVRALEAIVRRRKKRAEAGEEEAPGGGRLLSPHLRDMQRRFEEAVKTKVVIRPGRRKGSGRIVIEYYTLDDFDRVASMLGVRLD